MAVTFSNPAGFIEQSYRGYQTAASVEKSIAALEHCAAEIRRQKQPVLVLIDITKLRRTTLAARRAGLSGIKTVAFDKAAMYGPMWTQNLVNTLALVAGKKHKVRAFDDRSEAVRWLKSKR